MKYPPYGRRMSLYPGELVRVFMDAPWCWRAGKKAEGRGHHNFFLLPEWSDISSFFLPVRGHPVRVLFSHWHSDRELEEVRCALERSGAATIDILNRRDYCGQQPGSI